MCLGALHGDGALPPLHAMCRPRRLLLPVPAPPSPRQRPPQPASRPPPAAAGRQSPRPRRPSAPLPRTPRCAPRPAHGATPWRGHHGRRLLRGRCPRRPPTPRRHLIGALRPGRRPRGRERRSLHGLAPAGEPPVARPAQGVLRGALRAAPPRRTPAAPPRQDAAARVPRGPAGARGRGRRRQPRGLHDRGERAILRHLLRRPRGPRRPRHVGGVQGRDPGVHRGRRCAERVRLFPRARAAGPAGLRAHLGKVFKKLHAIFDEQIERRMKERGDGEAPKNDFLDLLLDYRGAEDGRGFARQTLLSLITDLFSAGSDSSAATVEWAMAELLQNPSSMAKARDELAQVIGSKQEIEESDIGQLGYLQAIVKETFRLHPAVPLLLPHQAETTTEVRGYTVPRGARVLVNVWAIGRDRELWPEPEKFMPERFLEKEIDFRGKDFELLPFGSGRRICPGMLLADRMVHLILATLLHRFKWRLPANVGKNELDMTENFGAVLGLATPLQAIAEPI